FIYCRVLLSMCSYAQALVYRSFGYVVHSIEFNTSFSGCPRCEDKPQEEAKRSICDKNEQVPKQMHCIQPPNVSMSIDDLFYNCSHLHDDFLHCHPSK
ncbi:MAG: hypothetical protein WBH05_08105, partial [Syntrophobacteria bacterium]